MTEVTAVRLRIRGRVQGVGYRAWAAARAQELGLSGFVCNRHDGSVEAMLAGDAGQVERMIADCRNGPPSARVDGLDIEPAQGITPQGFRLLPTV